MTKANDRYHSLRGLSLPHDAFEKLPNIERYLDAAVEKACGEIVASGPLPCIDARYAFAFNKMARDSYEAGRIGEAVGHYTHGIKLLALLLKSPHVLGASRSTIPEFLSGVYSDRASACSDVNDFTNALADYACALRFDNPQRWVILLNRAGTFERIGEFQSAERDLLEAQRIAPKAGTPHANTHGTEALDRIEESLGRVRLAAVGRGGHSEEPPSPPTPEASESGTSLYGVGSPKVGLDAARAEIAEGEPRVIRVFISSTFQDMQADRDELVKRTFPALRKLCESRGVTWGEVDLRWGVTDEQRAEGKVLPLCLEEIRRCRPYFIGLLGERYGWVPDEIPRELTTREEWLTEHRGVSVTELEILHGVLNDPQMADRALFYFRDPAYSEGRPDGERAPYLEAPNADETARFGREEAARRAEERRQKLKALKGRIRDSGLPLRENYRDPRELGELILSDMTSIIDRLFPEGSALDILDREARDHAFFARSRANVYIRRPAYFERLDRHVGSDDPPLVLIGESGSGKSALVANWSLEYRKKHPRDFLLLHFIGATPDSAHWAPMLLRIMGEFHRQLGIVGEVGENPQTLRASFARWLNIAAEKARITLILDGLNQLEDTDQALDLSWLPETIPNNIRLILTTQPGHTLDVLRACEWPTALVEPCTEMEREKLIEQYLLQYGKALSPKQMKTIVSATQAGNPLYTRALLEELRMFGVHEQLDQCLQSYLQAATIDQLFERILARWEHDYEDHQAPQLVGRAMTLLWAARRGLSEAELLELLGTEKAPLPHALWSPLHRALDSHIVDRMGQLAFSHEYMRQAVHQRYLANEEAARDAHRKLADYFAGRGLTQRKIEEEPWQMDRAGDFKSLARLLSDPSFFIAAWQSNQYELKAYWTHIEKQSDVRLATAYHAVLESPEKVDHEAVWNIAMLLNDTGSLPEALQLRRYLVRYYRTSDDRKRLAGALGNEAASLMAVGDMAGAMPMVREQEQLARDLDDKYELARSLGNQAIIQRHLGNLEEASRLRKECALVAKEMGNDLLMAESLADQALILAKTGNLPEALEVVEVAERVFYGLGEKRSLAIALLNHASMLKQQGNLRGALALHEKAECLHREMGDRELVAKSRELEGEIFVALKDLRAALQCFQEQERLARELSNMRILASSVGRQGQVSALQGELDQALRQFQESERLSRESSDLVPVAWSLIQQAIVLAAENDLDGALNRGKEAESLCRKLGNKPLLAEALDRQSRAYAARGEGKVCQPLLKELERLYRELGDKPHLQSTLGSLAALHYSDGDFAATITLLKEQEALARELNDLASVQLAIGHRAEILFRTNNVPAALDALEENVRLCRESGDKAGLVRVLGNQAELLHRSGQYQHALRLVDEAAAVAQEARDLQSALRIEDLRHRIQTRR